MFFQFMLVNLIISLFFSRVTISATTTLIINWILVILPIVFFVFQAIAVYVMAKKAKLNNLWMAFIPLLNYVLIGKLIGKVILFNRPVKNIGLLFIIVSLIETAFGFIANFGAYCNEIANYIYLFTGMEFEPYFTSEFFKELYFITTTTGDISGLVSNGVVILQSICSLISWVVGFATILLEITIIFNIFRKYAPQKALLYSLLSVFMEVFGLCLFLVRNNKPTSYQDYVKQTQRNPYGPYYGRNPYNNPYNNPNGYHNASKKTEEPFSEFDGENKNKNQNDNPFPEFDNDNKNNSGGDDFFN